MRIENDLKLDFSDVLIRPKRSTLKSRSEVNLERTFHFHSSKASWTGVPIMVSNMDTTGTFEMATKLAEYSCITCIHKFYDLEDWVGFAEENPLVLPHTCITSGTSDEDISFMQSVMDQVNVPFICLDVANGYTESFSDTVRRVREIFPNKVIMAGNVVTGEMVEELLLQGADIVKVGIGPGSVCTTRRQTGVGYPQLSAIIECADAAHGLKGQIIADGGCTCPGDFAKAFGGGADFVMAGGMFAGHDESGGELVERDGKMYKLFYGMSSATAMKRHMGGVATYRSSEGKEVLVPYRGPVSNTILDLMGGLRSSCTYVGAEQLKELSKRTTFIRVNRQLNNVFGQVVGPPGQQTSMAGQQQSEQEESKDGEAPQKRPRLNSTDYGMP
jgi:GMP reductase